MTNAGIVGDRVLRNFDFLYSLLLCRSPKQRHIMVENATKDQLLAIIEINTNIQRKNFKLTRSQMRRMQKYEDIMRKLSRVRTPQSARKTIQIGEGIVVNPKARRSRDHIRVVQRGCGFLPALLAPVLIEAAATGAEKIIDYIKNRNKA